MVVIIVMGVSMLDEVDITVGGPTQCNIHKGQDPYHMLCVHTTVCPGSVLTQ